MTAPERSFEEQQSRDFDVPGASGTPGAAGVSEMPGIPDAEMLDSIPGSDSQDFEAQAMSTFEEGAACAYDPGAPAEEQDSRVIDGRPTAPQTATALEALKALEAMAAAAGSGRTGGTTAGPAAAGSPAVAGSPAGPGTQTQAAQASQAAQAAPAAAPDMNPGQTLPFEPVRAAARNGAPAMSHSSGSGRALGALNWGACTNVGCVREHNEDSYLINFPLFAVADGMGGHAAGEVASTIAVSSLAESGLSRSDPYALGSAIEHANQGVIDGARRGVGRMGMGTTCTAVIIDGNRMAVGHVGDSRAYLLHDGKLLRVTHDHSLVEELVEAGKITPAEARVHPNRSVITRALGSDPMMRATAFTVNVTLGDRVLLCSDGLSSMVTDDIIEEAMVSSPTALACADQLVERALEAGGLDNVSVVVIDVVDDGIERHALRNRIRNVALWVAGIMATLALVLVGLGVFASTRYYLGENSGYVALYHGIPGGIGQFDFSELVEVTNIDVADLSETVEQRLAGGIGFASEDDARAALERYRQMIAQQEQQDGASATSSASRQTTGYTSALVPASEAAPGAAAFSSSTAG